MQQKLVSVIIPTYNRAHLILNAIQSVTAQTYPAIQIIVVDDGSQDGTAEKIAGLENVEYYYQENRGQAAARNTGLTYAKGEYIASLDSDDFWHADFLETAVAALERYAADFVFLNWTEISGTEEKINGWERGKFWRKFRRRDGDWTLLDDKEVRRLFCHICPAPSSSLLIRRSSFVSTWNEEMKIADDWYLLLEMVLTKPCRAAFTLSKHWTKRIHDGNIYDGRETLEVIKLLGLHDEPLFVQRLHQYLSPAEKAVMQKRLANNYLNLGRLNLKHNDFSIEHLQSIATAFKLAPLSSVLYILQLSLLFLENRVRILRAKHDKPPTVEANKIL